MRHNEFSRAFAMIESFFAFAGFYASIIFVATILKFAGKS